MTVALHLSVNELESLARKAVVGAGLDHGLAREAAQSLLHGLAAGIDLLPDLVQALQTRTAGDTGPLVRSGHGGAACRLAPARGGPACALDAAPALRDFAMLMHTDERFDQIEVHRVARPRWMIGQLVAERWHAGLCFRCLETGGGPLRWILRIAADDSDPTIAGNIEDDRPADLLVTPGIDGDPPGDAAPSRARVLSPDLDSLYSEGISINPAHYDALRVYFELTLVPDSELSRQHGAGAGLVDTD